MKIRKYSRKNLIVSAVQWSGENPGEVLDLVGPGFDLFGRAPMRLELVSDWHKITVNLTEWVLKTDEGNILIVPALLFSAIYERER